MVPSLADGEVAARALRELTRVGRRGPRTCRTNGAELEPRGSHNHTRRRRITMVNRRIAATSTLAAAGALGIAGVAHAQQTEQGGGAVGLLAAVVNAVINIDDTEVNIVRQSFNNLTALNNVLNNNDVDLDVLSISDFLNNVDINITLKNVLTNFLNNNQDLI